ncbi:OLC1v1000659C1 [Oldenlandia corymbosa var. corymbosa]|uniref:OLC1v1000659C1 n=1 Tax=Oldenlandia corymbosa var. corymbosa TaxID=529605 RepID=A0AAV1D3R7_OLDCO|nr:OLC1v1000659C1 [Oldenlandia corymbosa var. corymbosa]
MGSLQKISEAILLNEKKMGSLMLEYKASFTECFTELQTREERLKSVEESILRSSEDFKFRKRWVDKRLKKLEEKEILLNGVVEKMEKGIHLFNQEINDSMIEKLKAVVLREQDHVGLMEKEENDLRSQKEYLEERKNEISSSEKCLKDREMELQSKETHFRRREKELMEKMNDLERRNMDLDFRDGMLERMRKELDSRENNLKRKGDEMCFKKKMLEILLNGISATREELERMESELDSRVKNSNARETELDSRQRMLGGKEKELMEGQDLTCLR